jgi:hypothetical protein
MRVCVYIYTYLYIFIHVALFTHFCFNAHRKFRPFALSNSRFNAFWLALGICKKVYKTQGAEKKEGKMALPANYFSHCALAYLNLRSFLVPPTSANRETKNGMRKLS